VDQRGTGTHEGAPRDAVDDGNGAPAASGDQAFGAAEASPAAELLGPWSRLESLRTGARRAMRSRMAEAAGASPGRRAAEERWSARVTATSNALDLEPDVFKQRSARGVAASLKRSAEASRRRRSSPFRSAMSMLTFYINRAGRNLPAERRRTLERAKDELRALFGRPRGAPRRPTRR
jgi:hypothetical protein